MATYIPEQVACSSLSQHLEEAGLKLFSRGKVRDTYMLGDWLLLTVASDRVSIFDFVLSCTIPSKGEVLNAMTVFWLTGPLKKFHHHLVAYGSAIDSYLPQSLRGNRELYKRAVVVEELDMLPIEGIVRGYLTGSGLAAYQNTGAICGIALSPGLRNGDRLPEGSFPLFTPTTKAHEGHDEHITAASVLEKYGPEPCDISIHAYRAGYEYALVRGVILADTKFELGRPKRRLPPPTLILGDEVLTPDSSRFWLQEDWEVAHTQGKSPASYDKQLVRQWGMMVTAPYTDEQKHLITGFHRLDPQKKAHAHYVGKYPLPDTVLGLTTERYLEIFELLTGQTLVNFQKDILSVSS